MAPVPEQNTGFALWEISVDLVALMVSLVTSIITGTWVLVRGRGRMIKTIDDARLELERKINEDNDALSGNFGETVAAVRQKMTDMELWNRDNLVSYSTFNLAMTQFRESWQRLEDKLDRRFDAIESKLSANNRAGGGK